MPSQNEPTANVWDRQSGETAKQYHAFCVYLKLGSTRSIAKALLQDSTDNGGTSARQDLRSGVVGVPHTTG
jgi:hypothetical protein